MIDDALVNTLRLRETARYRVSVPTRYQDCDTNGHVNHGVFPAYVEEARLAMRRQLMDTAGGSRGFVVAGLALQYLCPLHYPAAVDVGISLVAVGRTSFSLGYGLFSGETCVAVAETRSVLVERATGKPVPLPDDFAVRIAALIGPALGTAPPG